jgi:hypothetical protein
VDDSATVLAPSKPPTSDDLAIPQEAAPPEPGASTKAERQRGERISLTGRVGAAVTYRFTPRQQLLAKFPLAVHPIPERTEWKSIYVFGARAAKIRDELKLMRGDTVNIVGYLHTREVNRKGTMQKVEEIYAVSVRK